MRRLTWVDASGPSWTQPLHPRPQARSPWIKKSWQNNQIILLQHLFDRHSAASIVIEPSPCKAFVPLWKLLCQAFHQKSHLWSWSCIFWGGTVEKSTKPKEALQRSFLAHWSGFPLSFQFSSYLNFPLGTYTTFVTFSPFPNLDSQARLIPWYTLVPYQSKISATL